MVLHSEPLYRSAQTEELPALVNVSDLVLTNDSGPMHLAAALKKEVVALFGPTDPKKYGPWEQMQNVIVAPNGNLRKLPVAIVAEVLKRNLENHQFSSKSIRRRK